ncbi:hypothetical protein CRG98_029540 [Punica granatum]|uniref:Uncharacterized protein n=1 Tax=Punica granatum TaxID=22663 RepID=A0A2I0J1G2_PUNGR|nr:hypothetical protein CRG98_029540 [Punica granatum]
MTLSLPRDEVVTCREPLNRARPPFFNLFLYRVSTVFFISFSLHFQLKSVLHTPQAGAYRSARVESHYESPITVILSQLGVQYHRPCIKRPPGVSCGAISSSGANRVCFDPTGSVFFTGLFFISGKSTRALRPKPPQTRSLVSWESNATGPARKFHLDQPVQLRQARLPVGSVADPTSLIRVYSFQGAELNSQALFPAFLDFSRIPRLGVRELETPRSMGEKGQPVPITCCTGYNAPNHRTRGPTPPNSLSACNPSAEWDLASIHRHTPNMAYVEGNLDWMRETCLDITQELDRSDDYSGNQPVLLQTVGSIGLDPRLLEPALP